MARLTNVCFIPTKWLIRDLDKSGLIHVNYHIRIPNCIIFHSTWKKVWEFIHFILYFILVDCSSFKRQCNWGICVRKYSRSGNCCLILSKLIFLCSDVFLFCYWRIGTSILQLSLCIDALTTNNTTPGFNVALHLLYCYTVPQFVIKILTLRYMYLKQFELAIKFLYLKR